MRILSFIIAICTLVGQVAAGPWPREKGQVFLSFGSTLSSPMDAIGTNVQTSHSLYLERGIGSDLTLGLDVSGTSIDRYSATTFVRLPLLSENKTHRFAVQFGAGLQANAGANEWMIHSGASWGRGFETRFGAAWTTLDAQINYLTKSNESIAKSDLTVGLKPVDRIKVMLQLQTGAYPGSDPYARLAPSVAWQMQPGKHLELGAQIGIKNDDLVGARLGTWLEF